MEWTTHAMSGMVLGYSITGNWKLSLVSGVMAVIPDLDDPKSKFGKPFFFISFPVNRLVGHRTFTHSLLFTGILGLIVSFFSWELSLATITGILAHILGDMITGKVQIFYPYKKKFGIQCSRFTYLLTDRIVRLVTAIIICLIGYYEVQVYL